MQDQWIYSSSFVPYTGEPIEFRLEEREQPISGTFADDAFHSRWADYGRSRVGSWRSLASNPPTSPMVAPTSTTSSFARIFKRLKDTISRNQGTDPIAPPLYRPRTAAMAPEALPRNRAIARGIDSNQMSS
ncbi:MAG: hypothetical protein ABI365_04365 [Lysobacteraceae bacterium]